MKTKKRSVSPSKIGVNKKKCKNTTSKKHVWIMISIENVSTGTGGFNFRVVPKCTACNLIDDKRSKWIQGWEWNMGSYETIYK